MCYVLLVIQLLTMNGCFPLCYGFFPVCHGLHRAVVHLFIKQKDRSATYIDMHKIHVEKLYIKYKTQCEYATHTTK